MFSCRTIASAYRSTASARRTAASACRSSASTCRTNGSICRTNGSCAPVGAQAFLLPDNGETERGVKTIDRARNYVQSRFFLLIFYRFLRHNVSKRTKSSLVIFFTIFLRFSDKIWLTCKFLCLTFFSRKDTKNNSLREHRSVASYIRLKASFQLMSNLHPYWLHQLFLVTRSAKAQSATAHAKPCGIRK